MIKKYIFLCWKNGLYSIVVNVVPFRLENLVPVCKSERDTLLLHLEKNFDPFQLFQPILADMNK
jgi:hypothetical protein